MQVSISCYYLISSKVREESSRYVLFSNFEKLNIYDCISMVMVKIISIFTTQKPRMKMKPGTVK
jgi:hypothetical protein